MLSYSSAPFSVKDAFPALEAKLSELETWLLTLKNPAAS